MPRFNGMPVQDQVAPVAPSNGRFGGIPVTDAPPSPETTQAVNRTLALNDIAMTMPGIGLLTQAGEALRQHLAANASPDSTVAKVAGTGLENGVDAIAALAHHIGNLPVGVAQLVMHGAAAVAPSVAGDTAKALDAYAKDREQQYQSGIPTNVGSVAGATAGELAPWIAGLGEARAIGLIPQATSGLGKLATLAAEGGTMGAAQPVTGDGTYAGQKAAQVGIGAATGPLLYGAGKLAGGVKGVAQHILDPQAVADTNIANIFGATPENVAKLRGAPSYVPGETPSAAQVLANPEAVQAERLLRTNPASGPAFVQADNANNAARRAVVQNLAGDDAAMAAARQARRDAVQRFTEASLTDSRPIARWTPARNIFKTFTDNPGRMSSADFDALQQAQGIAAKVRGGSMQEDDALQALQELGDSVTSKKAQDAFTQAYGAINRNMVDPSGVLRALATIRNGPLGVNAERGAALDAMLNGINGAKNINGLVGTDMLDAVRQEASKVLGKASDQSKLAYGPAVNSITDALDAVAPGYRDYLATYAQHSAPINTMESVSKLVDPNAPGSLNAAGDPQLAVSRLRQVLRGDDAARYPMSDEARAQLDQVRDSLLRRSISDNKIGPSGSNTASDLLSAQAGLPSMIFGPAMGAKGGALTRMLGGIAGAGLGSHFGPAGAMVGTGILGGLGDAIGAANQRVIGRVGSTAANANLTADALERYIQAAQRNPSLMQQLLFGQQAASLPAAATTNLPGRP